jgi:hypothetical protein
MTSIHELNDVVAFAIGFMHQSVEVRGTAPSETVNIRRT